MRLSTMLLFFILTGAVVAQDFTYSSHPGHQARVRALGNSLVRANGLPGNWSFNVIQDARVNAFAPAPYQVLVTEGLMNLKLSDDELAGVLAHEMAHSTRGHLSKKDHRQRDLELAVSEFRQAQQLMARHLRDDPQMMRSSHQIDRYEGRFAGMRKAALKPDPAVLSAALANFKMEFQDYEERVLEQEVWARQRCASTLVSVRNLVNSAERRLKKVNCSDRLAGAQQKNDEIDADLTALKLVGRAGYSSDGLINALERVGQSGTFHFGLSYQGDATSHPSLDRRMQVLRRVLSR